MQETTIGYDASVLAPIHVDEAAPERRMSEFELGPGAMQLS
jgi:hypothetical protein